jgi:hypothetical protein
MSRPRLRALLILDPDMDQDRRDPPRLAVNASFAPSNLFLTRSDSKTNWPRNGVSTIFDMCATNA